LGICPAHGLDQLLFRARETLSRSDHPVEKVREALGGYERVFRNRSFVIFALLAGLGLIALSMVWTLVAVYAKQNYGLLENLYGWLPTTNALMCVFVQFFVTRFFRRRQSLSVAAIGMATYALSVGSFVLIKTFWRFWLGMVIITFRELILIPTVSKYIAGLAPEDMRGRT
jgi:predicted MFS family arabinose efflux permease